MSQYVRYKGKIKPIGCVVELEDFADEYLRRACSTEDYNDAKDYYKTKVEFLIDQFYDEFLVSSGMLYEILEKESMDSEPDIFDATELSDGTVEFQVMYYNGGCGFSEAIDISLGRLR